MAEFAPGLLHYFPVKSGDIPARPLHGWKKLPMLGIHLHVLAGGHRSRSGCPHHIPDPTRTPPWNP
jgi:hypothetical protein